MKNYIRRKFLEEKATPWDYATAFLIALAASAIVYGLEHLTIEKFSNISGVLILAVLISAILYGLGPAILTAAVCSYLYDWLMVPPFFNTTGGYDNLIKFSVFVAAALITSGIASQTKSYAIQLRKRERELMAAINEREELRRQKEEETVKRQVESLRNAILASVSHDLKTPLSTIIGAMSSYKFYEHNLTEDDKANLTNSVLAESNRLLGYVNNILEVAKLENREAIFKKELVSVDDVIDLSIKRLYTQLKHYQLEVLLQDNELAFSGDERLMDIALGNVLDNAIKYSPSGGRIIVRAESRREGSLVSIEIEDEGPGVPAHLRDNVFDKFYRARQSDAKNTGTGLGLWIARRIIEAHGGSIRLTTRENGRTGTVVVITLPINAGVTIDTEKVMKTA